MEISNSLTRIGGHGIFSELTNSPQITRLIKMASFTGFSAVTIQFLWELQRNNNKEWFESHKVDYQEHLLQPLQALVAELGPFMQSIDGDFVITPAVNKTISRVYRDIRFSRDKSPYKTSHWLTFKRPRKEWQNYPAYFFELSPDSYRYGMGFYSANRQTMDKYRDNIDSAPDSFLSTIACYSEQELFTIEGEQYKRPLRADIPVELQDWYNRKSIYLVCNQQIDEDHIDRSLLTDLMHGFELLAPFYHYLCRAAV